MATKPNRTHKPLNKPQVQQPAPPSHQTWWAPPLKFATHAIVAIVLFGLIAISAFLLHRLVHWMEINGLEEPLVYCLRMVSYLVFGIDGVCFVLYLVYEAIVFLKELWKWITSGK